MLFKYFFKELKSNKNFVALFVLNICLGLLCFSTVDSVKNSIKDSLRKRSKKILTSDIAVYARRNLTEDEKAKALKALPASSAVTEDIEFFTMAYNGDQARLVLMKAIEKGFPLYGHVNLQENKALAGEFKQKFLSEPFALIYPEIATQLNLKVGDKVKVGQFEIPILDIVTDDSSNVYGNSSFAPSIYFPKEHLEKLQVIQKGSTLFNTLFIKLPESTNLNEISDKIDNSYTDPGVVVTTHVKSSEQVTRLTQYLNDYLGLAALVALFLSTFGGYFLFRTFVMNRRNQIAIYMTYGWSYNKTFFYYLSFITVIALIAATLCITLTFASFSLLKDYINPILPIDMVLNIKFSTLIYVILAALLSSLFSCLPLWNYFKNLSPRILIQDSPVVQSGRLKYNLIFSLPGIILFWIISVLLSQSFITGSIFVAIFVVALLLLAGLGYGFIFLSKKWSSKNITTRLALRNIQKRPQTFVLMFVVIGMCHLLSSLPAQIKNTLNQELESPEQSRIPSLFFFDIQEEQLDPMKSKLDKMGYTLGSISPLVRARINKINETSFVRAKLSDKAFSREEEREKRFRNRGFNLTYRSSLSPDEEILEGVPLEGSNTGSEDVYPVSLEFRFADRLGIHLGDVIEFDILGVPLTAKVMNKRKIRWTSFQPNFFIQFGEGVLEDAPKTYLASLPSLGFDQKQTVQVELAKMFSNISIIDVSRLVKKILEIVQQMGVALSVVALFSSTIGLIILFIVINHHLFSKRKEINLLKIIGGQIDVLHKIFVKENMFIAVLAIFVSSFICLLVSYLISSVIFQSYWAFEIKELAFNGLFAIGLTLLITLYNLRKYTRSKPALYVK